MAEGKNKAICKHFNKGYCQFKEGCSLFHSKVICSNDSCRDKSCRKRHPKQCRYKDLCRRRTICLYSHKELPITELQKVISENENIKKEIKVMKEKLEETRKGIINTDIEIAELKTRLREIKTRRGRPR